MSNRYNLIVITDELNYITDFPVCQYLIFIFFIFNYLDSTSYAGSRLLLFNAIKTTLPNAIAITILSKSNGINGITHTLNA